MRKWLVPGTAALIAAALIAAYPGGSQHPSVALAATATPLEAAVKADSAADSAVKSAESSLAAARSVKTATAEAVLAAESKEEQPKEETKTSAVVNSSPTGPGGTWKAEFADGFNVPLAQDPAWKVKTNSKGCCGNSNETSTEVASASRQSEANGLELLCEGLACSGVSTNGFTYQLGRGASFAFETVAKLPNNTSSGEDPGFWSISTTRWPPELDFFEYWGWNCTTGCIGGFPVYKSSGLGTKEAYVTLGTLLGEQPWLKYHRYTTVVEGSTFTEYVDGKRTGGFAQSVNTDAMNVILTHALRVSTTPRSTCFCVRSVAVYEDAAHAGQFVSNAGTAPGTIIK